MKRLEDYQKIILASASPRRLDILRANGIEPVVIPADIDESLTEGVSAVEAVKLLSREKAFAVATLPKAKAYKSALLIASDTVVYTEKLGIMGKPASEEEAFTMLDAIKNTSHVVVTGVTLIEIDSGRRETFADVTTVFCRDYSDENIYGYIRTGEPFDKAGGYAIQGEFGKNIDHIDGSYDTVVGLPFSKILSVLNEKF